MPLGEEPPRGLVVGAGLIEVGGSTACAFARPAAAIEAATPLPLERRERAGMPDHPANPARREAGRCGPRWNKKPAGMVGFR